MWGSTDKLAKAAAEGLTQAGVKTVVMPLRGNHRSDVASELLEAGALLVGSPTINKQVFPTVADVLSYLKGLRRKNLVGAAFGSYGWAGESLKQVQDALTEMGVATVEPVKCQYVPDAAALDAAYGMGQKVAARLKEAMR